MFAPELVGTYQDSDGEGGGVIALPRLSQSEIHIGTEPQAHASR